jgi:signal transduction histidine kinase
LRFPQDIETATYRLVQEALTNVARHACVQQVSLSVWCRDNKLTIQVEDEGNGFDVPSALSRGSTRGLPGMRQRVQFLKGKLTIDSAIGEGTRLLAEIPIPPTGVSP